jgi:integrase
MFKYATPKYLPFNPAASLVLKELGIQKNTGKRALDVNEFGEVDRKYPEITELWSVLSNMPRTMPSITTGLKLLLTLGIRSSELRLARWSDIDWDKRVLFVPVVNQKGTLARAKEAAPFRVPLTDFAIGLIESLRSMTERTGYIVGNPISGREMNPVGFCNAMERVFDGSGKRSTLAKTKAHDLRRTMRSHLTDLGVFMEVAEKCLNHAPPPLVAVYDRSDRLDQRREAMELWSDRLGLIVNPRASVTLLKAS